MWQRWRARSIISYDQVNKKRPDKMSERFLERVEEYLVKFILLL